MKFAEISNLVAGIPFIDPKRAKQLYQFILEKQPQQCLELGFAHGASSCYIAAALDEIGVGHLTAVDLIPAMEWQHPSIEELLQKTSLKQYVTVEREMTSYTWFLKKKIEERSDNNNSCEPCYDFCFIDGSKNWTIDGYAFFLVDKLLRENGWILFDDLNWKYSSKIAAGIAHSDGVSIRAMGEDEINTPHIERIFRLLVMQHPNYSEFKIVDNWWGWAHKVKSNDRKLEIKESYDFRAALSRLGRKLLAG